MAHKQKKLYIYGKHAVLEAVTHRPECVKKVFLARSVDDAKLQDLLKKKRIAVSELSAEGIVKGMEGVSHQGIIGAISPEAIVVSYDSFKQRITPEAHVSLVLLDEIQDPHNVGAIIRTAAAFGASGVLLPEHHQAGITGAVVKVSAGMAFRIPLVGIGNVNATIRDLKDRGFWIYGLAARAGKSVAGERFDAPAVFVFGNESEGIRLKTRELCDVLLSIPTHPRCESLNVAASAAVTMYAWSRQHPNALAA